jgi:hypothetical protein
VSKLNDWYENLDPKTKQYLESQPIYYGKDILKSSLIGAAVGFVVGVIVGFEWAYKPIVAAVKPLIG